MLFLAKLIIGNPLVSGLITLIVVVGVYTTVLKLDNVYLSHRVAVFKQEDRERAEIVKATIAANKAQTEAGKLNTKRIEADHAISKKATTELTAVNRRLLADIVRLRVNPPDRAVPPEPASPAGDIRPFAGTIFGDSERLLVEIAGQADQVRDRMILCQEYVKGLR